MRLILTCVVILVSMLSCRTSPGTHNAGSDRSGGLALSQAEPYMMDPSSGMVTSASSGTTESAYGENLSMVQSPSVTMMDDASIEQVTIDTFKDRFKSDGLGNRSVNGLVGFESLGVALGFGEMIVGTVMGNTSPVAAIHYSFLPTVLTGKRVVTVTARNMQTSLTEGGILRVSVNGWAPISRPLPGGQTAEMEWSFDFTQQFLDRPSANSISLIRLEWLRPNNTTGTRQLWVQSVKVY